MKRLLAISWAMPPYVFPRALQVARTLKYLGNLGWHSTVIRANIPDCLGGRVKDHSLADLYHGSYRTVTIDISFPEGRLGRLWQRLSQPRIPDMDSAWVDRAVGEARRLLDQDVFSAVVTFAQPWTDHIIGLKLSRHKNVPWVAHFSDPWTDSPYYRNMDAGTLQRWVEQERSVVEQADELVFTTERTAQLVMSKYPTHCQRRVHVVPHGYDSAILEAIRKPSHRNGRFRMVYTGSLYGGRSPTTLLKALQELKQKLILDESFEMLFIGSYSDQYLDEARRLGVDGFSRFLGQLGALESMAFAREADVLLVVDAPSRNSVFLPSKLVDYLMFRKPILGLTPHNGESADLLRRLECPVVEPDDISGIAAALEELFSLWKSNRLVVSSSFDSEAGSYDAKSRAAEMAAILDNTCKGRRS